MARHNVHLAVRGALRLLSLHRSTNFILPRGPALQHRTFGTTTRLCADKGSQSFKSQLYESTQQRLKRERAEQERYSQYQTQSQGGRYAALMFGTIPRSYSFGIQSPFRCIVD